MGQHRATGRIIWGRFCFPCGYKSSIEADYCIWPKLLQSILKGIELYKKPDILISGHQGGLLSPLHQFESTLKKINFLAGLQPDTVICAVSPFDELKDIERIVNIMDNLFNISIICFVLADIGIILSNNEIVPIEKTVNISQKDWHKKSQQLKESFQIPVINVFHDNCNKQLTQIIETHFR